jgi:transcriptional regulator with XRE-family HTH domain
LKFSRLSLLCRFNPLKSILVATVVWLCHLAKIKVTNGLRTVVPKGVIMNSLKYRRSSEIKLSREASLLREIRELNGVSIREAAKNIGCSESLLRHIEKGRANVPKDDRLQSILMCYGLTVRQFKTKLKGYKVNQEPIDELSQIIKGVDTKTQKNMVRVCKAIVGR